MWDLFAWAVTPFSAQAHNFIFMEKNKIVLTAEAEFIDDLARQLFMKLEQKVVTINERTKNHTRDIQMLNKRLKELEKAFKND